MDKVVNLARRRKVVPHLYAPLKELGVTEDKAYEVYAVSNKDMDYANELKFLIKNDIGEMVWIEEYSIEKVPIKFIKMFKDIRSDLTVNFYDLHSIFNRFLKKDQNKTDSIGSVVFSKRIY